MRTFLAGLATAVLGCAGIIAGICAVALAVHVVRG